MDDNPQRVLNNSLDYLEKLSKESPEVLGPRIYTFLTGFSNIIIGGIERDFADGWVNTIYDKNGKPIFDNKTGKTFEHLSKNLIEPIFKNVQRGGMFDLIPLDSEYLSIDNLYIKIKEYIKMVNDKFRHFSREVGPFQRFYSQPADFIYTITIPMTPPIIIPIPINPRSIPIVISFIIEGIRLLFSFGPLSNDLVRKILTFVLGLVDIMKGDWKQGLLSFMGFFGKYPLVAGLLVKTVLNIYEGFIPEYLRDKMEFDIYQSGKTIFITFWLWGISNFAPAIFREETRRVLDELKAKLNTEVAPKLEEIQKAIIEQAAKAGYTAKVNQLDKDFIPGLDDIQNLVGILGQSRADCSKEFQQIIEPLKKTSPMRLLFELMGFPTVTQSLQMKCGIDANKPLNEILGGQIVADVVPATGMPSAMPTGMPPGMPSAMPTGMPPGMPSAMPTGMPSAMPTGMPSAMPTGMPPGVPPGMPTGMPPGMPTGMPPGMPTGMPSAMPTGMPRGVPPGVPTGMPPGMPTGMPSAMPTGMPSAMPTGMPRGMPPGVPPGVQQVSKTPVPKKGGTRNRHRRRRSIAM